MMIIGHWFRNKTSLSYPTKIMIHNFIVCDHCQEKLLIFRKEISNLNSEEKDNSCI